MAVDYLSALNAGSGLNVTQIVDALIDAEKAPREATLNSKIEEKTVSISAFAEVKKEFSALKTSLTTLGGLSVLDIQATGPSGASNVIDATVTDSNLVKPFDFNINVSSLAQPQTISFGGYGSELAKLDASNLSIDLGVWTTDNSGNHSFVASTGSTTKTIALTNSDTLASLKNKINELDIGISATIVKVSADNYSLAIRSASGTDKQIRIRATSTSNTISKLSYDPQSNGSGAANGGDFQKQVASASNAQFTLNGLSLTRTTNTVSDVIEGVSLNLKAISATDQRLTAKYDETLSLDAMKLFVEEMNTITKNLINMNKTSLEKEQTGALAGDTLVRAYRNKLRTITTTPITGFGADPIYLSNFGIMTERDGSLSLNETKFKAYFAANPQQFSALTKSNVKSSSLSVSAEMTGTSWTPGNYAFKSIVKSATSVLSANEATAQSFKAINSTANTTDGQLSDSLQSYVEEYPTGQWSITGTDSNLITVDTNGVVTITGGTNYEAKSSYAFNLVYTVSDTEKFTESVTLNINNLAERTYKLSNANIPSTVIAGDVFSVTVDGQTITTGAIGVGGDNAYSLQKLVDALNLANTSADGNFSADNGDLIFTYNDAAVIQTGAFTSGLTRSPNQVFGTVSEQITGAVTARSVSFLTQAEINPTFDAVKATDQFKIDIQSGGNSYSVAYTLTQSDVDAIAPLGSSDRLAYLANKLDEKANVAASGLDIGIDFSEVNGTLVGTSTLAGTANNADTISQLKFSANAGSSFATLGSGNVNTPGTSTAEVVKVTAPGLPTIQNGDKFSITLDNNGNSFTVTTAALTAPATLTDVKNELNNVHGGANGTFSVSGNDLLFTYNHNTGNINNTNDTGLILTPAPGTITQVSAGVNHAPLSTVTEVSHLAGNPEATLDGTAMSLENGIFKISSGGARGINIKANGNQSATLFVGRSMFDSLKDFSDDVLTTNGDLDKKVARYNSDITEYKDQLAELEARMATERIRYVEQFTAMETAVAGFKETGSLIKNLMDAWKAGLS